MIGECLCLDLRGYGNSSYNEPLKNLSDFSKDINLFMKEAFPIIENYFIVG